MAKSKKKDGVEIEVAGASPDMRKYRAEDALRTLSEAEKVRKDKSLTRDVDKARKEKMRDLASIEVDVAPRTIGRK